MSPMRPRANFIRPMGVRPPITLAPRLQQILDENIEAERGIVVQALGGGEMVTTDDSATVAKVVDMITDDPARFAVRYLNLERYVAQLSERVNELAAREPV